MVRHRHGTVGLHTFHGFSCFCNSRPQLFSQNSVFYILRPRAMTLHRLHDRVKSYLVIPPFHPLNAIFMSFLHVILMSPHLPAASKRHTICVEYVSRGWQNARARNLFLPENQQIRSYLKAHQLVHNLASK